MMKLDGTYNRDDFLRFLAENFLPDFKKDIRPASTEEDSSLQKAYSLGRSESLDLQVFEFSFEGSPNKRVTLTKDAFQIMRSSAIFRALAIFHSPDSDDWRLSLMTATPERTEKGKVVLSYSNPKRLSFFLGPNAKVNTPKKFILSKGNIIDFGDLKSRFSIEVVNKEFYQEISELFTQLVGGSVYKGKKREDYEALLKLPSIPDKSQTSLEFAVRLIGRVIFCWFLREKKSDQGKSLMPQDLLSLESVKNTSDYYHKILEPIFFEVLNKPIKSRKDGFAKEPFSSIPYLNGGLFSPHDDDFFNYDEGKQAVNHNMVHIPDEWIRKLFEVLETYNFTIDENTGFDEELSIDPEMLGRIFENLLAEINPETGESARKSTGSYYTPRVIVDYMIDESLLLYLKNQTQISEEKLRAVISYDLNDDEENSLSEDEREHIISALEKVKILDPACGSGAFPIGALQKIVFILQQADPIGQLWFRKQIKNTSPELRRVIKREFEHKNFDYIRKLGIIRENIYGVDIQPIATEISRLRCFLTLVVDERIQEDLENRGIEPLPNLDFKFVTANTLIGLSGSQAISQRGLFEDDAGIRELKELRDMFFNAPEIEREQLKLQFVQTQNKMFQRLITEGIRGHAELTTKLTTWDPFSHESSSWFDPEWMFGVTSGFDIVIENPPYGAELSDNQKEYLKKKHSNIVERIRNSYLYFVGESYSLAKENGIICIILPNEFLFQIYMTKARQFFLQNAKFVVAINVGEDVFEAIVPTCVIVILKETSPNYPIAVADLRKSTIEELPELLNTRTFTITTKLDILTAPNAIFSFDKEISKLVNRLTSSFAKFETYCHDVANGISTSCDEIYIVSDEVAEKGRFEKKYLKECIRGGQFNRFFCPPHTNEYILYIKDDFEPTIGKNIYQYLEGHKALLIRKSVEKKTGKRKWHILFRSRNAELFKIPKILFRQTGDKIVACLDKNVGYYCIDSVNVAQLNEKYHNNITYFLGLLNSRLINFFYQQISQEAGRVLAQVKPQRIRHLPIAYPDIQQQQAIGSLVEQIINAKIANQMADTHDLEEKIDQMVYKLYGLTEEEINVVEGKPQA